MGWCSSFHNIHYVTAGQYRSCYLSQAWTRFTTQRRSPIRAISLLPETAIPDI